MYVEGVGGGEGEEESPDEVADSDESPDSEDKPKKGRTINPNLDPHIQAQLQEEQEEQDFLLSQSQQNQFKLPLTVEPLLLEHDLYTSKTS